MSSYNSVTFYGRLEGSAFRPHWTREKTIVRRKLGGGNSEDLQDVGFGNYFVELEIRLAADASVVTLQGSAGLTKRTLTDLFGANWPLVMLTKFGRPKRGIHANAAVWLVDVRFEYEAA